MENQCNILDISEYGQKVAGGMMEVDWDSEDNMQQIRDSVQHVLKGYSCKKGCKNKALLMHAV